MSRTRALSVSSASIPGPEAAQIRAAAQVRSDGRIPVSSFHKQFSREERQPFGRNVFGECYRRSAFQIRQFKGFIKRETEKLV